jgi:hypothetical protein
LEDAVTTPIPQLLPPRARTKFTALTGAVEDARAALAALGDRIKRAENAVFVAQHNVNATDPRDAVHAAKLAKVLEGAHADLAVVDAERGRRADALAEAERLLSPVANWFAQLTAYGPAITGPIFEDAVLPPPALKRGETLEAALERLRGDLFETRAELFRLRGAPLPAADIKARLTAEVDRMMRQPQLDIGNGKVKVQWPDVSEFALHPGNGSVSGMLIWLFRDIILERLTGGIDDAVPDGAGIPLTERGPREAALLIQILRIERQEEALVEQILAAGRAVMRRRDVDPMALLGIGWPTPDVQPLQAAE